MGALPSGRISKASLAALGCLLFAGSAQAQNLAENFDNVAALSSWVRINRSSPLGSTAWFQGNSSVFPAQAGAPSAYIAANFNNTAGTGTISNWLQTPTLTLVNGATMTFYSRTTSAPQWPDRLQVRMSTAGSSTDVGTSAFTAGVFTTLLLDINPGYSVAGYPTAWTQYTVTISGVPSPTTGRLAFRYFVESGGPTGTNSDFIGIDTFRYTTPPSMSVSDCATFEGNAGSTVCNFTVTLSSASAQSVGVTFTTADVTAVNGLDYQGGVVAVSFPPGSTVQTVPVGILGDILDEPTESFAVSLSNPTNGIIADGQGTGTIFDDDPTPSVGVSDCSAAEGNSGVANCNFSVNLSGPSSQTVSVTLATADGTAVNGQDYVGGTVPVSFPPGSTSQVVPVGLLGDILDEPDETFVVNLSAPTGATLGDAQGTGTIVDDDPAAELSIGDAAVVEGDAGSTTATFFVTTPPSAQTITVSYQTAPGTAGAADFTAAAGALTFPPGVTSRSILVLVTGDLAVEPDETFTVDLSGANGAPILDGQALGTIADDDAPSLSGIELSHGSHDEYTLLPAPPGSTPDVDFFRLFQKPRSSWEVVVDGGSGDTHPLLLERLAADNTTVLETGVPAGAGGARVLRWVNALGIPITSQHLRIRSGGACGTDCGADDAYRIRAYETTGAIPRFNNSGTQVSVLVLQNPSPGTVTGTAWFWDVAGSLLGQRAFTLAPKAALVVSAASVSGVAGKSGTVTVTHDGGYGGLAGKAVALEPATGFSFDSPLLVRPR